MAGLPWYRMDSTFHHNPKVVELAGAGKWRAIVVWAAGLGHSVQHGTDGLIRNSVLPLIHGRRVDAKDLVTYGLWHEAKDGWWINGFEEFQQTSETTERLREVRSKVGSKGACIRHHGADCGCWETGDVGSHLRSVK